MKKLDNTDTPKTPANSLADNPSFYSLKPILSHHAIYNMIIGERSNGKTYATLLYAVQTYFSSGKQSAYIRRWKEDFRGKRGQQLFASLESNNVISILSGGLYDRVRYYSGKWYMAKWDESLQRLISEDTPFMFAFSLNEMEHDKSISYPDITIIIFDEFLTRQYYLPDEFVLFMNVLSTIIRHRDNVLIFMLGNTVNKYCPYFKEMGLSHIPDMPEGKIDVYKYGSTKLTVAVERCASPTKHGKASDKYFAFDNPALQMITGGAWEIDIYPHLPYKYNHTDILLTYFIIFDDNILQCEVIYANNSLFTYIHTKTTDIKYPDTDIIYSLIPDPRPNYIQNIFRPTSNTTKKILSFFQTSKVFYQDNEVGELINNYLKLCKSPSRS